MAAIDPFYATLMPAALIAGFIRGFAGFGGPLVMLPILNHFLAPAASMWVMMWIDLFVNVRLLPEARGQITPRLLVPLSLATVLAMPFGVALVKASDPIAMKRVIGGAILVAALVLLSGWRYPGGREGRSSVLAGLLSGLVMGATSLAVTAALYLHARQDAAASRANFIVWVFAATIAFLVLLVALGAVAPGYLREIAWLAPLYLGGTIAGSHLHARAPDLLVRRFVLLLAATVGGLSMLG